MFTKECRRLHIRCDKLRVPCTESTMKQLSQTHYMEPVRPETKLKKDVASGISLKRVSSDAMA